MGTHRQIRCHLWWGWNLIGCWSGNNIDSWCTCASTSLPLSLPLSPSLCSSLSPQPPSFHHCPWACIAVSDILLLRTVCKCVCAEQLCDVAKFALIQEQEPSSIIPRTGQRSRMPAHLSSWALLWDTQLSRGESVYLAFYSIISHPLAIMKYSWFTASFCADCQLQLL